jgi:hypothetical protein
MKNKAHRSASKPRKSPPSTAAGSADRNGCRFAFSDGRHCRMPRWKHHPAFCLTHAHQERQLLADLGAALGNKRSLAANAARIARDLASLSGEFKTAGDVNHVLGNLFSLLAQGRIPRRNAVALAYIGQLLIQTLPNVRREVQSARGDHAWMDMLEAAYDNDQTDEEESPEDASDDGTEEGEGESPDEAGHDLQ